MKNINILTGYQYWLCDIHNWELNPKRFFESGRHISGSGIIDLILFPWRIQTVTVISVFLYTWYAGRIFGMDNLYVVKRIAEYRLSVSAGHVYCMV